MEANGNVSTPWSTQCPVADGEITTECLGRQLGVTRHQVLATVCPRRSGRSATQIASPMLTAIMSGGVGISGRVVQI